MRGGSRTARNRDRRDRTHAFPIDATVTFEQLDPRPINAGLGEHEPVSWLPALSGSLVTSLFALTLR